MNDVTRKDYPLRKSMSHQIKTPGGAALDQISFDTILNGQIDKNDCRTSSESLLFQAKIAEDSGNYHLANNFRRAAEMVEIDGERIIEIYNAIRPYRSTAEELEAIVRELREKYHAERTATFVEEAMVVLKERKKLRGDR